MVNINLTVSGSKECIACSVGAGAGTSSSAVALTRNVLGLQPAPIWMPTEPDSVAKNEKNYGALTKLFLKPTLPFTMTMRLPVTNATIDLMSVYQPFPLRVNGEQCDACFQIGEFKMPDATGVGTSIVVLIPLKTSPNTSNGGAFINAFANAIPDVLAGEPDKISGYPDGQVTGLSDWKISDILQSDRPFYTWTNKDGTQVIVMAEPIGISDANMTNIKRLPITKPGDAVKEISDTIYYKSAPPLNVAQTPSRFRITQPPIPVRDNTAQKEMIGKVLANVGFFILTVFAVWLAIWLAMNKGASAMTWISNKLGDGISSVAETTKTGIAAT
jgi:hypothetical protein